MPHPSVLIAYTPLLMKRIARITLLLISALAFAGCDDENPYSNYRANFVFDSTIHPYNQARSPGQFICVRKGKNIGQYRLYDALGNETTVNIPEIQLQQSPFFYGLGGLIIGTPMLSNGELCAYDWACPNCELASRRLELDRVNGHATCPGCGVKFDLNSGGIAIEGKSRPMWIYRIFGPDNSLVIQN